MMKRVYLFILILSGSLYAQSEWTKWSAVDINYTRVNINAAQTQTGDFLSLLANGYRYFISDLDGDNCPFEPSCSAFFVRSIKTEGIVKGFLMFSDRFVRDINFFKGLEDYPVSENGKYYDPPEIYSLLPNKYQAIPNEDK
ncbi:membrane protein insertion efficiency factor YidD [Melioribacter sp. Ez-97]|uniref:membrane protein insertion efficiency factor YidD n=1 Tax=Melioribacter sp. Ez-97 TaxID=3423434 RepID=UPI003EDA4EBE